MGEEKSLAYDYDGGAISTKPTGNCTLELLQRVWPTRILLCRDCLNPHFSVPNVQVRVRNDAVSKIRFCSSTVRDHTPNRPCFASSMIASWLKIVEHILGTPLSNINISLSSTVQFLAQVIFTF